MHLGLLAPSIQAFMLDRLSCVTVCVLYAYIVYVHHVRKKLPVYFLSLTLQNADRFSKFFHRRTCSKFRAILL